MQTITGAKESDNKMMFRKELKAMLYGFGDEKVKGKVHKLSRDLRGRFSLIV